PICMNGGGLSDVDPGLAAVALQDGVDEADGAEAVGEGGEVGLAGLPVADGAVDGEEVVLEAVGVALRVAAGVVGVRLRGRVEEAGVLDERLVRAVAAAEPQLVRPLLV